MAGQTDPEYNSYELEDLNYLAHQVYEDKVGAAMCDGDFPWARESDDGSPRPREPADERWDFDDDPELRRRLPQLAAIYLEAS